MIRSVGAVVMSVCMAPAVTAAGPPAGTADQTAKTGEPTTGQADDASEVVVTASAVASINSKPILETPRTVQAISGELISNISPSSILSITKFLPGIVSTVAYNDVRPQYDVRGIFAEVRRNGLVLTRTAVPYEDIARVELLQGPGDVTQGGNKTPGGVLNFVSKRAVGPDFVRGNLIVNDLGNVLEQVDVNHGFGDGRYGIRANIGVERIRLPNDVYGKRFAIDLAGRIDLTPQLTLDVNGFYNTAPRHQQLIIQPAVTGTNPLPDVNYDRRYGQRWARDNYRRALAEARLSGEFGNGWSLLVQGNIVNGRDLTYDGYVFSITPAGVGNVQANKTLQENHDFSGRAALTKQIDFAPWASNQVSLIGDYYRIKLLLARAIANPATPINYYTNVDLPDPQLTLAPLQRNRVAITKGYGIGDELTLFDKLIISGGLKRYMIDNRSYDFQNKGVFLGQVRQSAWLPNVSALYKLMPRLSAYVSYFKSFEPGTLVNFQYANTGELLPPLRAETYELGTKAQVGGMLLSLTGYRFVRPSTIILPGPTGNSLPILAQSGAARYKGLDLTASGRPVPRLNVTGGLSLLRAKVTKTDQPATLGKTPADVPRFQASLFAEYEATDGLFLSGGVYHKSEVQLNSINTFQVPGYTTFDAGVRYEGLYDGHRFKVSLLAENVGDKFYFAGSSFGNPKLGGPRTVKLGLGYDF